MANDLSKDKTVTARAVGLDTAETRVNAARRSEPTSDESIDSHTLRISRRDVMGDVLVYETAFLEVRGAGQVRGIELGDEEISIGRSPEATIQLPLKNISRIHASIYKVGEEYFVEDKGSTNGTYLNNVGIVRSVLRDNDQIEIGEARLLFTEKKLRDTSTVDVQP